jgi:hypothetical protein
MVVFQSNLLVRHLNEWGLIIIIMMMTLMWWQTMFVGEAISFLTPN